MAGTYGEFGHQYQACDVNFQALCPPSWINIDSSAYRARNPDIIDEDIQNS
jgi:hypothetical protein